MECFLCSKEINNACPTDKCEFKHGITHNSYEDACTIEISGGFGSEFDCMTFHGVICDLCLTPRLKNLYELKTRYKTETFEYHPLGRDPFEPQSDFEDGG